MVSALEGNLFKKLPAADGIRLWNRGWRSAYSPATSATTRSGVTYRVTAATRQSSVNSAAALGSFHESSDGTLSPCVATSPTTVWIRPATLRSAHSTAGCTSRRQCACAHPLLPRSRRRWCPVCPWSSWE